MVEFRVDLSMRRMRRYMRDIAIVYPRELSRSIMRVCGVIRRQMTAAVKGPGSSRVGSLAPLSDLRKKLYGSKSGGKLRESRLIRISKRGRFAAVVDYVPGMRPYAARWQDGGGSSTDNKGVRRALHIQLSYLGIKGFRIDPSLQQPARPFVPVVRDKMAPDFHRQVLGNLTRIINSRANRGGAK